MHPFVLGPDAIPVVDKARAQKEPELAILSVMAYGKGEVDRAVQVALAAVAGVELITDQGLFVLYSDLIEAALSEAARKAFQMLPQGYEFQSETVRSSIEKGRVAEKAAAVLEVLDTRGLSVSDAQRERVLGTKDLETLTLWLRRAVTVGTTDALFE